MSMLNIIIPAGVSLIVGIFASLITLSVKKIESRTNLNLRGIESLEKQLTNFQNENKALRLEIETKDQQLEDMRSLKYELEANMFIMQKQIEDLRKEVRDLLNENFQLQTEIDILSPTETNL